MTHKVKICSQLIFREVKPTQAVEMEEILSCSICLDLLKEPVTTSCGHNYCTACINRHWDVEERRNSTRPQTYSCPQCRMTFRSRPVLLKNTKLANLVEDLKKSRQEGATHSSAAAEDLDCDFCTGRKRKASKSCLDCVASYCEEHLQPHCENTPLKRHKLVAPTKKLQEMVCSRHDEVMKMFCRTDQQCICIICSMDEHKGHNMVSAAAERNEKQRRLQESRGNIKKNIQDREKDMKLLKQMVKDINLSADQTVDKAQQIFTQLTALFQRRYSELKEKVRLKQQNELSAVRAVQEKLEKELSELKKRNTELEQLSNTEDHIQFVQSYSSLPALRVSTHCPIVHRGTVSCFDEVTAAVSELKDHLQKVLMEDWTKVSLTVEKVDVLPSLMTRADMLKDSKEILLDPNTAHKQLRLSEGNRKATLVNESQPYPDHPDRFTVFWQVLSRESLTGCCYWEVEWTGRRVNVAVAYKSISRTGSVNISGFGTNNKSWSLAVCSDFHELSHNSIRTKVSGPPSSRIGVYLDHTAGVLSFYSVSRTKIMTLLHRVHTTFTEPLYAGVRISCGESYKGSVEFRKPY